MMKNRIRFAKATILASAVLLACLAGLASDKVAVYGTLVGIDQVTVGTVDQSGLSIAKNTTVDLKVYTVVRVVFRDDKLVNVRTWPRLEQTDVSGGKWLIR
jgi:hypothetical protein